MADFSFISRCGLCSDNPLDNDSVKIDCNADGNCCIDISIGEKSVSCASAPNIIDCLNNPDSSSGGSILPLEIYQAMRRLNSPCINQDDQECLPFNQIFTTNDPNEVDNGQCLSSEPNNYALLTDPEKTPHPVFEMSYCDWLVSGTTGDPPIPGGGCFTELDNNDDPSGSNTCGADTFRVPQCSSGTSQVCCPGNDFASEMVANNTCKEGSNYFLEVKNCTGYDQCGGSCGPPLEAGADTGMCTCNPANNAGNGSNPECKPGDKCGNFGIPGFSGHCYTPDQNEIDQCFVVEKALQGVCVGPCLFGGSGVYPDCCVGQITEHPGTKYSSFTGGSGSCDAGMECRRESDNVLLMPGGQTELDFGSQTGVGVCICSNAEQCAAASTSQNELYTCTRDPASAHNRNVCVSGTPDSCAFDPTGAEPKGKLSTQPNIPNIGFLPGFDDKGCEIGVSCSIKYGSPTYGFCHCSTDAQCDTANGYVCSDKDDDGVKKCLKIEEQAGLVKPSSLPDFSEAVGESGKGYSTFPTGGHITEVLGWTNKRCGYCDELVNQGCSWSRDDPNCNKIGAKTIRAQDCTVEIDAPPGQLIWDGWGNDWHLCCPSGIEMPLKQVPMVEGTNKEVEFININRNMCSSWAQFAESPNKDAQTSQFCQIYCPDKATQDQLAELGFLEEEQVCDNNYYNTCINAGCPVDVDGCEIIWGNRNGPSSLPKIKADLRHQVVTFESGNKTAAACNEAFGNVSYIGDSPYAGIYEGYSL